MDDENSKINKLWNSESRVYLIKLLRPIFGYETEKTLGNIINNNDKTILLKLHEIYRKQKYYNYNPNYASIKRAKNTADNICYLIPYNLRYNLVKYLDIGSENSDMPLAIANKLGTKYINCINIKNWQSTYQLNQNLEDRFLNLINFMYYDGVNIPFQNSSLDLITILMVLHHVEKLDNLLKNIHRVLKKNGLLIIKEHDVGNDNLAKIIDIEHYKYDTIYFGKYVDKLDTNYYSFDDMKNIIVKNGFKMIKYMKFNNTTKSYFCLFMKL